MKSFVFIVLTAALTGVVPTAHAQAMYRCGSSFSQTPCGDGQVQLRADPVSTPPPVKDWSSRKEGQAFQKLREDLATRRRQVPPATALVEKNYKTCEAAIRRAMKDPEGSRVKGLTRIGPSIDANGGFDALIPGVDYSASVNGKNSYGAFVGEKPWICVFDVAEVNLVRVKEVGPGYLDKPWFDLCLRQSLAQRVGAQNAMLLFRRGYSGGVRGIQRDSRTAPVAATALRVSTSRSDRTCSALLEDASCGVLSVTSPATFA